MRNIPLFALGLLLVVITMKAAYAGEVATMQVFPPSVDLGSLNGNNGFTLRGNTEGDDLLGWDVAPLGDVNGDGHDDIILGAPQADPDGREDAGKSYVLFGSPDGFPADVDLLKLNGIRGFVVNGEVGLDSGIHDLAGSAVGGSIDFNADGYDDIIIGASSANFVPGLPSGATGEAYVIFGRETWPAEVELSALDGVRGFTLRGVSVFDATGYSLSEAGDVNGDGFGDIVIGANGVDGIDTNSGAAYVVYGGSGPYPEVFELESLDGTNGFVAEGFWKSGLVGWSVAGAGDVNGDGYSDIIAGGNLATPDGLLHAGESYVVFGGENVPPTVLLETLDGSNGFAMAGTIEADRSGFSVAGVGDVNGDGLDDVAVGAPGNIFSTPNVGQVYIVYGAETYGPDVDLSTLDGTNGFVVAGVAEEDATGVGVNAAGDVNGDGFADIVIGAMGADTGGIDSGAAYVVFGTAQQQATVEIENLDSSSGFAMRGITDGDEVGYGVSSAGDVNSDGYDDVLVGARMGGAPFRFYGEAYVVYGRPTVSQ